MFQADVDWMELDLASLASVKRFAQLFCLRFDKLHYLILSAGVYLTNYNVTEDGFEEMMQVR